MVLEAGGNPGVEWYVLVGVVAVGVGVDLANMCGDWVGRVGVEEFGVFVDGLG